VNTAARYVKIVEWSEDDQCFVGSCPGLFYGGCHGDDEKSVFAELCQIVEESVKLYEATGRPLPQATSGYDWANAIVNSKTTS
jgi:predicted RNase H-like HicB family nuclease